MYGFRTHDLHHDERRFRVEHSQSAQFAALQKAAYWTVDNDRLRPGADIRRTAIRSPDQREEQANSPGVTAHNGACVASRAAIGEKAGKDELELVHRILAEAKDHLTPVGLLVCEIGGNRKALERAYPRLEFTWPETSDPDSIFVLQRQQLDISS